nr:MAG TPA: hypothetical protein [Caudoviricetes sp.]
MILDVSIKFKSASGPCSFSCSTISLRSSFIFLGLFLPKSEPKDNFSTI